jgi:hypothetical protein
LGEKLEFSSFEEGLSIARECDTRNDWSALASLSEKIAAEYPTHGEGWLLNALASTRLGDNRKALISVNAGLKISPTSVWGLHLGISIHRLLNLHEACRELVRRLMEQPSITAEHYASVAEFYAELGEWAEACRYSTARRDALFEQVGAHAASTSNRERITLVVQAFARADRVEALLDSLDGATGREECNLVICVDSVKNSRNEPKYRTTHEELIASVANRMPSLLRTYNSVALSLNPGNLSTALTAQRACDLGFSLSDKVVFFEEDCIVSPGFIHWFKFALKQLDADGKYWFAGGESPFFNSEGRAVSPEAKAAAEALARHPGVSGSYVVENYVPSTCFGTTLAIWEQVRGVRGLPRGAEHITTFLSENNKITLFPTVPFVKDVGMQDVLGYSVAHLGHEGVKESKTVYLMNDLTDGHFEPANFDSTAMYRATASLDVAAMHILLGAMSERASTVVEKDKQ